MHTVPKDFATAEKQVERLWELLDDTARHTVTGWRVNLKGRSHNTSYHYAGTLVGVVAYNATDATAQAVVVGDDRKVHLIPTNVITQVADYALPAQCDAMVCGVHVIAHWDADGNPVILISTDEGFQADGKGNVYANIDLGDATLYRNDPIPDPVSVLEFCQNGCDPRGAVTMWDSEICLCCGGTWGSEDSDPDTGLTGVCRNRHLVGQVWIDLLMSDQDGLIITP